MKGEEDPCFDLSTLIPLKNEKDINKIKSALQYIIKEGINYEFDVVDSLNTLIDFDDVEVKSLAAQSIAELCKCEKKRISYAQSELVIKLLNNLNQQITLQNFEVVKQSCRALGNICYDSYVGRDLVLNSSGISIIVNILPNTLSCDEALKKECYDIRLCICKLLLILMLGGNDYIKPALECDFNNIIYNVIYHEFNHSNEVDCLEKALLITSVVAEHSRSLIIEEKLTLLIVDILKSLKFFETIEPCLECLHYQAEHDEVKLVLAKAAVPQILWNFLKRYKEIPSDEDVSELRKLACDLIALILTGDTSMDLLYSDGKGEFYLSMVDSLHSDDVELSITAILAIGNFARTDKHCIYMMETGVFSKLMSILVLHKNQEDNIRLQHVVLSGLRNLVIPQKNKFLAIEKGILPLLVEMIPNVTQYHVVFKLLATLRMLVDGQENVAKELVLSNMLDRVARWGVQAEHNGVSGEASRLLARIIRQLQSQENIVKIVKIESSITCMVNMLGVTHAIMQNEAIISLTKLYLSCCSGPVNTKSSNGIDSKNMSDHIDNQVEYQKNTIQNELKTNEDHLVDELIKAEFSKQLNVMLEGNATKIQLEIAENLSKLLNLFVKNDKLKEHMYQCKSHEFIEKIISVNENLNDTTKNSFKEVIALLHSFNIIN